MKREPIVFVGTCDLSGHFRGKSFPEADLAGKLARGVGESPTNIYLGAFGAIQFTSFGTRGEVFLVPDPSTRVCVPFEDGTAERFLLADLRNADDSPWSFCPRHVLRRALAAFGRETGLEVLASFEQELTYSGVSGENWWSYELDGLRRQGAFGETLLGALRAAGVVPDSFLCEYGPQQYEVTVHPALGLRAADEAVITRELAKAVAHRLGHSVSFTPVVTPSAVSNGTHIHFSLLDRDGRPVLYEEGRSWNLSTLGRQFVAGLLEHLPAVCALTAPAVVSYYRLRPNRWAPVYADVGLEDRGTAIRVAPVNAHDAAGRARQFNLEFRVADATASPYLALAAMVFAGLEGVRARREIEAVERRLLPRSLGEALNALESSPVAAQWLGPDLLSGYIGFKRAEIAALTNLDEAEICRRYAAAY